MSVYLWCPELNVPLQKGGFCGGILAQVDPSSIWNQDKVCISVLQSNEHMCVHVCVLCVSVCVYLRVWMYMHQ